MNFTAQLEKAREATDAANIRAAYAEMMADVLTGDYPRAAGYTVTTKQQTAGWGTKFDFPADLVAGDTDGTLVPAGGTVTLTYSSDAPHCDCKLEK